MLLSITFLNIMINKKQIEFDSIADFYKYFTLKKQNSDTTAILAGHFILDYDRASDSLKPLIKDKKNTNDFNMIAEIEAGDFPKESFNLGLSLYSFLKEKNNNPKLFLLVNDHKFPSISETTLKQRIPVLRRKYYKTQNEIPDIYQKIIHSEGLSEELVFLDNNFNRGKEELLDSETYLFSEYIYRKRFDRKLKKNLLKLDAFYGVPNDAGKTDVYFKNNLEEELCVLEDNSCGCSGEIMQVIYDLYKQKNINDFFLIVPSECSDAVKRGIESIVYYLNKQSHHLTINILSGLPTENHRKLFFENLTLMEYDTI